MDFIAIPIDNKTKKVDMTFNEFEEYIKKAYEDGRKSVMTTYLNATPATSPIYPITYDTTTKPNKKSFDITWSSDDPFTCINTTCDAHNDL